MKIRDRLDNLDRLQHTRWFKIVATCVVLAIGIGLGVSFVVAQAAKGGPGFTIQSQQPVPKIEDAKTPEEKEAAEFAAAERTTAEAIVKGYNNVIAARGDPTPVLVGIGIVTGLAVAVVWLGLGLTMLAVVCVLGLVGVAPWIIGEKWHRPWLKSVGQFVSGLGVLAASFFVQMELLKAVFSGPTVVLAIARNVVSEALRMRVSIVFIVVLLLGLAALPGLLDESTPLRYRVQAFLQYGTGITFWIIAILVLFLSVGTVAFEQRDKVIWQTMTKPVAPWKYLLGKWMGAAGVGAVLLGVSAAGIFLFTEYLREQKAHGEVAPFIGADGGVPSPDRTALESQVLAARESVLPIIPPLTPESLAAEVQERVEGMKRADMNFRDSPEARAKFVEDIGKERLTQFLTIEPGNRRLIEFANLKEARDKGWPMTLRYKISVGSDDPRETQTISFAFPNSDPMVQTVPLGQTMSLEVSPAALSPEGQLQMFVINGNILTGNGNVHTMSFPPDGIEVYYPVGSYRANFARAMIVLWLKLAMLAMVGVTAATFLSFGVASLLAFGTFLLAETTAFLVNALDYYSAEDPQGGFDYFKAAIRMIAVPFSWIFRTYSSLEPTSSLVDGRMMGWGEVGLAVGALGGIAFGLYLLGVMIFRNRELATYSGQ